MGYFESILLGLLQGFTEYLPISSSGHLAIASNLFGVDAVRYFVLHEMPFENDGSISWDLMLERFNSDLANILGNLVSRTISMSNKYFQPSFSYQQAYPLFLMCDLRLRGIQIKRPLF